VWLGWDGAHVQIFTRKLGVNTAPIKLTSGNDHDLPQVSGDRVVWLGWDGAHWQIYTRKIGVNAAATKLTTDAHNHSFPQVSGNQVVWLGFDGHHDQVFTRNMGVDHAPIKLTSDAHGHDSVQVSGARVVWRANLGANWQIFYAKPLTTPTIVRSPNKNSITLQRKNGSAYYKLSATVRDTDHTLVAGKRAFLQTSKSGKTWKNTYKLMTDVAGAVSQAFNVKAHSTMYFRWYCPASAGYRAAYSAKQNVVVK